ncbi:MAG TPA: TolC family protein [Bacteroidales bacterium]|nr:TolC family protein [Bacteroidales bacterium]
MYNIVIGILFLLISTMVSAQDDLDGYLQTAAKNNPGLKARFNEYMAALEVAPQVKVLPDPQLAFGYFIQPVETRVGPQQFKISASQMFPWFGTLRAKENAAIQIAKAKYEAFEEAKSKLFNDVRSTYYNLYFTGKAISITDENLILLSSLQNLALIKVEAGMVSVVDEYRIEMEIGDLENQLALLIDKNGTLEIMFNNLINTDNTSPIKVPMQLWDIEPSMAKGEIRDSILTWNHQLLNLDMQTESLRYKQELARLAGKPDFKIGFDYTIVGKGNNNMAGTDAIMLPTVGITIPLYRNKYKSMLNEAVFMETAKKEEKINKQNILETVFEQTWKDFADAKRRLILNENQSELARKSLKLLETEYVTNSKNFEEILRMERKLLIYELELEKARADKQAAISFISYLMGE